MYRNYFHPTVIFNPWKNLIRNLLIKFLIIICSCLTSVISFIHKFAFLVYQELWFHILSHQPENRFNTVLHIFDSNTRNSDVSNYAKFILRTEINASQFVLPFPLSLSIIIKIFQNVLHFVPRFVIYYVSLQFFI